MNSAWGQLAWARALLLVSALCAESPVRSRDVDPIACPQLGAGPSRNATAFDTLDPDLQRTPDRRADRIAPPHLLSADEAAHGDELSGAERDRLREPHHDRIVGLAADRGHGQRYELHPGHWLRGA